jgi:hypothetical protein
MKLRLLSGLVPACLMTVGLAACGGSNGPNVGQVKQDFDHPTGSAKDQQGVAAAAGAQEQMTQSGAGFTGGGVPGFSLRAEDLVHRGFAPFVPHNFFSAQIDQFKNYVLGQSTFALGDGTTTSRSSLFDSCIDKNKLEDQIKSQAGQSSFQVSLSIDLSACAGSGYTGSFDINMSGQIERTASTAKITLEMTASMHSVCETATGTCIDGGLAEEAIVGGSTMGTSSSSGDFNFTLAWNWTATGKDKNGLVRSLSSKGGERLAAQSSGGSGSAQYELLFYVKDGKGQEVSYVLRITADSMGNATLEIRCSDGSLTCTRAADGSAMCSGMVDGQMYSQSWDAMTYDSAKDTFVIKK